jgi:hypothetical protein
LARLFTELQPEGNPIGAEVGDTVVHKRDGARCNLIYFTNGALNDESLVGENTKRLVVCHSEGGRNDLEYRDEDFIELSLEELVWPNRRAAEQVLWG